MMTGLKPPCFSSAVAGPLAVGARAVLYTGAVDRRDNKPTAASAVATHYDQLPALIDALVGDRHDP